MGYLDFIPGVGGAKIVVGATAGLAVGTLVTGFLNERKLKKAVIERDNKHAKEIAEEKEKGAKSQKELHALKKQHAKEENERKAKQQKELHAQKKQHVKKENEQQQREINKIAIMTQLALSDGKFCEKEQLFIYKNIIGNPNIRSKIKIQLLTELLAVQKTKSFFQLFEKHYSSDAIGTTNGELKKFRSVLIKLMGADGKIDKKEQNYLNNIFKSCGLPKLTH